MTTAQRKSSEGSYFPLIALNKGLDFLLIPVVCFVIFIKTYELIDLNLFIIAVALVYTTRSLVAGRFALDAQVNWLDVSVLIVTLVEVSSYAASSYQTNSLHYLAEALLLFFFYCLVRFNLSHDYQRTLIFIGLSLLGLWISSRALYSFWRHYDRLNAVGFNDPGDFKHLLGLVGPDYYATGERITVLLLLLPFPLILFFKLTKWKLIRLLFLGPVLTILLALSVTFSRAVYVGAITFFLLGSLFCYRYKLLPAKRLVISNLLLGLVLSACLIPLAKPALTTLLLIKTESQVRSVEGRVHLWSASVELARRHPAIGVGHYNFPMRYAAYTEDHSAFVASTFNYFLQILVEKGVLGLLAYCFLLLVVFKTSAMNIKAARSEFCRIAIILFMAAIAAVIVRDLTYSSIFINKGANALLWFMVAGNARRFE